MIPFAKMAGRPDRRRAAGFTLIELLVVLVILGLLAAFAAPQVLNYLGRAKSDAAQAQVQNIASISTCTASMSAATRMSGTGSMRCSSGPRTRRAGTAPTSSAVML